VRQKAKHNPAFTARSDKLWLIPDKLKKIISVVKYAF